VFHPLGGGAPVSPLKGGVLSPIRKKTAEEKLVSSCGNYLVRGRYNLSEEKGSFLVRKEYWMD